MITRYKTASGSMYEVRTLGTVVCVRRVVRSNISQSERVGEDWRLCESATMAGNGCLLIVWGEGRDEHSPDDGYDDSLRLRTTMTTMIVDIEELTEP